MAGYRWARIDLQLLRNPKLDGLDAGTVLLFIGMITYACSELTDGYVSDAAVRRHVLADCRLSVRRHDNRLTSLRTAGVLSRRDNGWQIVGFAEHQAQAMRENVEAERAGWRERKRRQRAGGHGVSHGDDTTRHDTRDNHAQHWSPSGPNGHGGTSPEPSVTEQLGWQPFREDGP